MSKKYENYGILLLSGDESKLYNVTGSSHKLLCIITCHAPGKQGHGGQSQQRLDRIRIETINEYHKRVLEKVKLYYIDNITSLPNIKGLILAGPSQTKHKIAEHDMFDYRLKKIILKIITTAECKNGTIYEVISQIDDILNAESIEVKNAINKFLDAIKFDTGLAVYGQTEVKNALQNNLLNYLIISKNDVKNDEKEFEKKCETSNCKLIVTASASIDSYGGIVGILWYPIKYELNEESHLQQNLLL